MKSLSPIRCSFVLALLACGSAQARLLLPLPKTDCLRSANLLVCEDRLGNAYAVAKVGSDTYLRGYDSLSGRHWRQTSSRYGRLTFFSGIASDGEIWIGSSRRLGWNDVSRLSSSSGTRGSVTCNRLVGCQ
ncbi:glutamine synthetase [Pseudomonas kuykendallii]|nr:glutamine synthetase [Pseudomonas kuykendallii]MCQ4272365.1 glutamine synthetase [Pseudomonas kuykendallii]